MKVGLQSLDHLVAKVFVVEHVSEHVEPDERNSYRTRQVAGNLAEVDPVHVRLKDRRVNGRQADGLLLPFSPARRAGSLEKLGARADDVFVNGETLFLDTYKDSDNVAVVVASKVLVCDDTSSPDGHTDRGRLVGRCAVSFSFSFSRGRFAEDASPAIARCDLCWMIW